MAGFGDLLGLMRDAGALRQRIGELQEELARRTVEGSAGGGLVVATVNGRQELVGLKIDPEVVSRDDLDLLEELVKAAVGQAMAAARDLQREAVQKLLGGLPLPPGLLDGLML
jgi:hypothetical protein